MLNTMIVAISFSFIFLVSLALFLNALKADISSFIIIGKVKMYLMTKSSNNPKIIIKGGNKYSLIEFKLAIAIKPKDANTSSGRLAAPKSMLPKATLKNFALTVL